MSRLRRAHRRTTRSAILASVILASVIAPACTRYGSDRVYYSSVQAIGFPYQYMALIAGEWELVRRVGA